MNVKSALHAFALTAPLLVLPHTASAQTSSGTIRIMAVGDSITEGFTPDNEAGTPSYRQALTDVLSQDGCDFEMVGRKNTNYTDNNPQNTFFGNHEGYSGQRANHIRDSLNWNFNTNSSTGGSYSNPGITQMMADSNADAVLLHIGTNDLRGGNTVNSTADEISDIIQKIHAENSDAIVFVANVIPHYPNTQWNANVNQSVNQLGNIIENRYGNNAVTNVHVVDVNSGYTINHMQSDQIHPNATGEAHIADAFASTYSTVFVCNGQAIDLIAPETFIGSPTSNKAVSSTHTFSGTATDTGGAGLNRVQVAIKNTATGQWYDFAANDGSFGPISRGGNDIGITNANLTTSLPTNSSGWQISRTLPAGNYQFYALAVDEVGNDAFHGSGLSEWPVSTVFSVAETDNTAPTVTISPVGSPTPGNVTISGSSSDSVGIDRNRLLIRNASTGRYWNGNSWVTAWSWFAPDGTNDWSYTLNLPAGNFSSTAWSWDNANNRGISTSRNFTVGVSDNEAPSVNMSPVSSTVPGIVSISGVSTDNVAADRTRLLIKNVNTAKYWNGSAWVNSWAWFEIDGTTQWSYDLNLASGTYSTTAWTWDTSNNRGKSPNHRFTIATNDSTPPIVDIVSPTQQSTVSSGDVFFNLSSTDNIAIDRNRLLVRNLQTGEYWNGQQWVNSWAWFSPTNTPSINSAHSAITIVDPGQYRVVAWTWDTSNNASAIDTEIFTVNF